MGKTSFRYFKGDSVFWDLKLESVKEKPLLISEKHDVVLSVFSIGHR